MLARGQEELSLCCRGCEDEPPSHIDFGKNKCGGPFSTEQVEDIKTFVL